MGEQDSERSWVYAIQSAQKKTSGSIGCRQFFSWMQNKLNGKQVNKEVLNTVPATHQMKQEPREEFSDWPHGLLAIGTFGNPEIKENLDELPSNDHILEQNSSFSDNHDLQDFTPEEILKLQKELTKLLSRKPKSNAEKEPTAGLPLDRFLNCPSSLDVDRRMSNAICSEFDDNDEDHIERTISVILDRCRDICANKKNKSFGKKSFSFLLKKMFVCGSGFVPKPSFIDTFPESRMEKLLRTLLHKKIDPPNSPRWSLKNKYLNDKPLPKKKNEDETQEKNNYKSKWDKTDSEYIVLEI